MPEGRPLVLASASPTRRALLSAAGVDFEVAPADVDENEIHRAIITADPEALPERIAEALARAKAQSVSRERPHALVIGSDQVLTCDGEILTKSPDRAAAREALLTLRGRRHQLISVAALAQAGEIDWTAVDVAELEMRRFSDAFLDDYLARYADSVLHSVGAYRLEGPGIQLFERVVGDYFTILGLPLISLLVELRRRGVLFS